MKKSICNLSAIIIGFINMLIGSCGGIIAVKILKKNSLNQTKAHATAIAIILPMTLISSVLYLFRGNVKLEETYIFLLPGLIGSVIGSYLLPRIPKKLLNKIFSFFMIYAGIRMMIK